MIQNLDHESTIIDYMLSSTDVAVLLKICAKRGLPWTQRDIANELFMSQSSVNRALKSCEELKLYNSNRKEVSVPRLEDALVHGARYFLAPKRGGEARGMPTAWAGPPMRDLISTTDKLIPVWPDPEGNMRGIAFEPLYPAAARASKEDPLYYELLSLVDVLREGTAREAKIAASALHERLKDS